MSDESQRADLIFFIFILSHTETELSQIWFLRRLEMQPSEVLNVERVVGGPGQSDVDKLCDRIRVPRFETLRKLYLGANSSFCLLSRQPCLSTLPPLSPSALHPSLSGS